ncbi:hypothetical protein [Halobacteriovorax sp. JY17]|uniref:hypothetical protein n=1 Tax=Halobacteriovorax sp. JY17 TaxID=2014617 RepID=UPI000C3A6246|nr:hypothetical protein [Halobacteriovorax sp. JY17]PIK14266.1 MAG: hypothetical protein CES88_14925 [Halobacteriovorax sp. JY17]
MNFKTIFFLIFLCASCGVKGPPKAPAGTAVPSFLDSHLSKYKTNAESEDEKKKSDTKEKKE